MSTDSTPPPEDPSEKRRKRLLSYSTKNMVYSLAAVLVVVFALWAITPNPPGSQRRPAEIDSAAVFAADQAPWPIWSPARLNQEWTGSFVRWAPREQTPTWRLGMVSPSQQFVELRQAVEPGRAWRREVLAGLQEQGPMSFSGPGGTKQWQVWTGVDANEVDQVALVRSAGADQPATTIVSGTADIAEMSEFIQSLTVVEAPAGQTSSAAPEASPEP